MLEVREVKLAEDYPELCEWWRQWALIKPEVPWTYLPWKRLPPTKLIVCDETEKICAGFLYRAESGWSFLEWIVTNPKVSKEKRSEGLEKLIHSAKFFATQYNSDIFTSINHPGLIKKFQEAGFAVGDEGMTNMVWKGCNL